jgi:hypothetical protein
MKKDQRNFIKEKVEFSQKIKAFFFKSWIWQLKYKNSLLLGYLNDMS